MKQIDIILPLYKPHDFWENAVTESVLALKSHFAGQEVRLNFCIVNDGSDLSYFPDEKLNKVRQAAGEDSFRFLTYAQNRGKGYCLRYAVSRSEGDYCVYTDGDFPFGWEGAASAADKLLNG